MNMIIQSEETKEWFIEEPHSKDAVFKAYKETIPDILDDLLIDPRSSQNTHIVNRDFSHMPRYLAAFNANAETRLLVLSVLYVFPQFRKQGFGSYLVDQLKLIVRDIGVMQVAVNEADIERLHSFYTKRGFITTREIIPNLKGLKYLDYFWSGRKIKIARRPDGVFAIEPVS